MAKTFGTGADPKGLVNRGVEGSGAAQIFRPSQAVQDFVTGQRQQGLQKQKQKQAEAKAKAEKQKTLDKTFNDLLDVDLEGWTKENNQEILGRYSGLEKKAAELLVTGAQPTDDAYLQFKNEVAQFKLDLNSLKTDKQLWREANTKVYEMAKNKDLTEEQFNESVANIKLFEQLTASEREKNRHLLEPSKVEKQYDYEKAVSEAVKNVKGNKKPITDEKTGAIITTIEVPQSEIENTVKYFQTTPAYKQKTKSLLQNGVFQNEEDAKEFLDENLKIRFFTQKSATKGDVGSGYGDGAASTYRAEYENIRPSDINIESYGLTPSEAMNMGFSKPLSITKKPYLRSINISSSPKKAPVPLTIESNIKYNLDGKEYALTSNDPIIPGRLVEYNTLDGTKYLFLFNIKGTGNAAAVIDSGNKEVFERYFLKKGKTIEDYLNEGEKTKNVNATPKQSAPQSTTTKPIPETQRIKTPNYKGVPKGGF
jgi:hypothetical protein